MQISQVRAHFVDVSNLKKEKKLNEEIATNEAELSKLRVEVDLIVDSFNQMKAKYEEMISKMEKDLEFFQIETVKNKQDIDEMKPGYGVLCQQFEEKSKDYDDIRHKLIGIRIFLLLILK